MTQTALITGASSGIGKELARLFARDGIDTVLVARSMDKLKELKDELEREYRIKAYVFPCDLSIKDAAEEVYAFTEENGIVIDYLVNDAGFGDKSYFKDSDWDKQYRMIMTNIMALTHLTHKYLPGMCERKNGHILNIGSLTVLTAGPTMSIYFASKAYVRSFSEAIYEEAKKDNVYVTCFNPGPVATGFEKAAAAEGSAMYAKAFLKQAPDCAEKAYIAMKRKKALSYYPFYTKAANILTRLVPRALPRKISFRFINDKYSE